MRRFALAAAVLLACLTVPSALRAQEFSISDALDVFEDGAGTTPIAVFEVFVGGAFTRGPVSVFFETENGSALAGEDYFFKSGTLEFMGINPLIVEIEIIDDNVVEGDETFSVVLSMPMNATIGRRMGQGLIKDADTTALSITDAVVIEGDAGTVDAVFKVTLTNPSDSEVTVDFATDPGTATLLDNDYQHTPGTLRFGPFEQMKPVTVPVNGDATIERDETFSVLLMQESGATIDDGEGIGTILNDDADLSIDDVTVTEGDTGTVDARFTVTLSNPSAAQVTVRAVTQDDSGALLV